MEPVLGLCCKVFVGGLGRGEGVSNSLGEVQVEAGALDGEMTRYGKGRVLQGVCTPGALPLLIHLTLQVV